MGSTFRWGKTVYNGVKFPWDLSSMGSVFRVQSSGGQSSMGSITLEPTKESVAKVWQVIACMLSTSFLAPDVASINDARDGIE